MLHCVVLGEELFPVPAVFLRVCLAVNYPVASVETGMLFVHSFFLSFINDSTALVESWPLLQFRNLFNRW
jgi:hypothetical protein